MKNLKILSLLALSLVALLLISCGDDRNLAPLEQVQEIDEKVKSQFTELGLDVSDIRTEMFTDPFTNETQQVYILENDIRITYDHMLEMLAKQRKSGKTEQYHTTNLVEGIPRTISVLGFVEQGNANELNFALRAGLQQAVANYNNLSLGLTLTLTFGNNIAANDIVVWSIAGGGGGNAGFPSNGDPFNLVQIQAGTVNFGPDVIEHVITHEIGHCIGLRHTDFFNRSISCGNGGNEGGAGIGAIHIPGTPAMVNIDMNSIMLACFNGTENGEFSADDITSLNFLYQGTPSGGDPILTVSPTSISVGSGSSSRSISVTSNVSWTVTDNVGWISVSPTSGVNNGSFTVSIGSNTRLCEPRSGLVTVNGGAAGNKTIRVSQAPRWPTGNQECP
jgi:hypothetical protein